MVKETRIVFEPKDIHSIGVVCVNCDTEVLLNMGVGEAAFLPGRCPGCSMANWRNGCDIEYLKSLVDLLTRLRHSSQPQIRVKISLLDDESS